MRCPVFRGIGGVANKYYLLFQHHLAPPVSTYTTGELLEDFFSNHVSDVLKDALQTTSTSGMGEDPRQLENAYVLREETIDSSYIIGSKPGVSFEVNYALAPANSSSHTWQNTLEVSMRD
jgi:hypothetical protein